MDADQGSLRVRFGDWELDLTNLVLRHRTENRTVRLDAQVFRLLRLLIEHAGDVVTREDIRTTLWGNDAVDFEHGINVAIRSLRRDLGDPDKYIETLPRLGYKFLLQPQWDRSRNTHKEKYRALPSQKVFLSYASQDREMARSLAAALEGEGILAWWDQSIPPGKTFPEAIEAALNAAACVIVVWSTHSVTSDWVKNEAREGLRRHILIPVLIAEITVPFEFRHIQAADLIGWKSQQHSGFRSLIDAIREMTDSSDADQTTAQS